MAQYKQEEVWPCSFISVIDRRLPAGPDEVTQPFFIPFFAFFLPLLAFIVKTLFPCSLAARPAIARRGIMAGKYVRDETERGQDCYVRG